MEINKNEIRENVFRYLGEDLDALSEEATQLKVGDKDYIAIPKEADLTSIAEKVFEYTFNAINDDVALQEQERINEEALKNPIEEDSSNLSIDLEIFLEIRDISMELEDFLTTNHLRTDVSKRLESINSKIYKRNHDEINNLLSKHKLTGLENLEEAKLKIEKTKEKESHKEEIEEAQEEDVLETAINKERKKATNIQEIPEADEDEEEEEEIEEDSTEDDEDSEEEEPEEE